MVAFCSEQELSHKRLKLRKFVFDTILDDSLYSPIPLYDVIAIKMFERRNIGKLLPLLPPLHSKFGHLKRIHDGIILLTEDLEKFNNVMNIKEIEKLASINELITIKVPAIKPKTRLQYEESKKYWPTAFHENKILEKKMNRTFFDAKSSEIIVRLYFRVEKIGGGLIYDPKANQVIIHEVGLDSIRPLQHPVIRLVKALSDLQQKTDFGNQYLATANISLQFSFNGSFRLKEVFINTNGNHIDSKIFNYADVMNIVTLVENKLELFNNCLIGLAVKKSALFVGICFGILKSKNAFIALDSVDFANGNSTCYLKQKCKRFKISCLISEYDFCGSFDHWNIQSYEKIPCLGLFIVIFNFQPIPFFAENGGEIPSILYAIQTSGSSGEPKIVHVPETAIMPNIIDFVNRFELNSYDSVLFSTSVFFDPSIVELFCAAFIGTELIIPVIKENEYQFLPKLLDNLSLNFVQLTPAVLQIFPSEFLKNLFGPDSKIKNLLIGGDEFPLNLIKYYYNAKCPMKIFNVYGLTEVSCWATIYEVNLVERQDVHLLPIGVPLMNTKIMLSKENTILIYGRKCAVDFHWDFTNKFTFTGDIGFMKCIDGRDLEAKEIYVQGRKKNNSILQSNEIEHIFINKFSNIIFSKVIYVKNCRFLFLNHVNPLKKISEVELRILIPKRLWPTRIFWNISLKKFTNSNGKINESSLLNYLKEHLLSNKFGGNAIDFLKQNYNLEVNQENSNNSLNELGFGSLEAAELAFFIEDCLQFENFNAYSGATLISTLLDQRTTLKMLIKLLEKAIENSNKKFKPLILRSDLNFERGLAINIEENPSDFFVTHEWRKNMGMCVDATPLIDDGKIFVGSHNGTFSGFECVSGKRILNYQIDSAFETNCTISRNYIAIGALNGELLMFDKQTLNILDRIETKEDIKMAPVFDIEETVFVGSYDGFIYGCNLKTKQRFCYSTISNTGKEEKFVKGIRSTPLIYGNCIILATLSGWILNLNKISGAILWSIFVKDPIFANVIRLFDTNLACIITVRGSLISFNLDSGLKCEVIELSNTVFDVPTLLTYNDLNLMLISGGGGTIFLIRFDFERRFTFMAKYFLESSNIVKSPVIFDNLVFVLNTKGDLFTFYLTEFIELAEKSEQLKAYKIIQLKCETFGSAAIMEAFRQENLSEFVPKTNYESASKPMSISFQKHIKIFIGGRDDFLHSFAFKYV